jgi:hypothetical protein
MGRFLEANDLLVWVNGLLEDLTWGLEQTTGFEASMRDLGSFLGFGSQRPEQEIGKGPDNLWATGELRYFVIECKSGASSPTISKGDCNQLIGSMSWFTNTYDATCNPVPIIVHPARRFHKQAAPLPQTRVVDKDRLAKFKERVRSYAKAVSQGKAYKDRERVKHLLLHFELSGPKILDKMTVGFQHET